MRSHSLLSRSGAPARLAPLLLVRSSSRRSSTLCPQQRFARCPGRWAGCSQTGWIDLTGSALRCWIRSGCSELYLSHSSSPQMGWIRSASSDPALRSSQTLQGGLRSIWRHSSQNPRPPESHHTHDFHSSADSPSTATHLLSPPSFPPKYENSLELVHRPPVWVWWLEGRWLLEKWWFEGGWLVEGWCLEGG